MAAANERLLVARNLERNADEGQGIDGAVQLVDERETLPFGRGGGRGRSARNSCPTTRSPSWPRWKRAWWATTRTSWTRRVARQKGVVDTLYQVEKSHIPFPDEPPIVYPDAEVWQQLTARRKEKYSSMDLAKKGTAEKKIDDALKSPTQLEFVETPLRT